ncbi:hypothetical protein [Pseudarthrobacter raffinosi]|uniref:hypothetical protein n=1 Tax=Pseudarthrobacter raffinosi TaxID=2953651 RepID=UPI00208E1C29|nr:hypothetical protein [Pseudarthrobacter sp. MDT3-28]
MAGYRRRNHGSRSSCETSRSISSPGASSGQASLAATGAFLHRNRARVVAFMKGYEGPVLPSTYGELYIEYRRYVP